MKPALNARYAAAPRITTTAARCLRCRAQLANAPNDTTAANYDYQQMSGIAAVPAASFGASSRIALHVTAGTAPAGNFDASQLVIPGYAGGNNKTWQATCSGVTSGVAGFFVARGGTWKSTAAITRLTLTAGADFLAGSKATLYGRRAP